jgi:hypothetical protein
MLYTACERIISEADLGDCNLNTFAGGLDHTDPPGDELSEYDTWVGDLLDASCDALANISGYPVGRCSKVYRPCRDRCHFNGCACGCALDGIRLPGLNPQVTAVKVDGATLVAGTDYTVIRTHGGFQYLERVGTNGSYRSWPTWQQIRLADSEVDTFAVTIAAGTYADPIARLAAAEIANDILKVLASEREAAPDGVIAAQAYGLFLDWRRFSSPTEAETMRLAGLSSVQRFIGSRGGPHPVAISSPGLEHGWTLYEIVT